MISSAPPSWWPFHQVSKFTATQNLSWHSQTVGDCGPRVLFIHGTGASTHSWAPVLDILKDSAISCAVDLPGHGFSTLPATGHSTLRACTMGISDFLKEIDFTPDLIVGHSAGAAIAVSLATKLGPATRVLCINAAFGQFPGLAGVMFPYFAKAAAATPFAAHVLSIMAHDTQRVQRLLDNTGSKVPPQSLRCYTTLFKSRRHVQGTLQLMAEWDLHDFLGSLPKTKNPITFVTGLSDKTVPPDISRKWANTLPQAHLHEIVGCGHLVQEEAPQRIVACITQMLCDAS